jgi:hypothetical protein
MITTLFQNFQNFTTAPTNCEKSVKSGNQLNLLAGRQVSGSDKKSCPY